MANIPAYIRVAEQIRAELLAAPDPRERKLPTQEDLAVRFGVSRATIVRSLSRLVAEGYIHSQQGSGVFIADTAPREVSARCIGLIVPNLHAFVVVQACRGVERRARQLGFKVLLASSDNKLQHEQELVAEQLQAGAKGIVIYPVTRLRHELQTDYLCRWTGETPIVGLDIACAEWPCSRVLFDNFRLGSEFTQQLLRHGHRNVAFMHIAPDYLHNSIHDRREGWLAAMDEAGIPIPDSYREWPGPAHWGGRTTSFGDADYDAIASSLRSLRPRPDAVIAWNDIAAAHLTQALINEGVTVPDEIRVAGFDSEPLITRLFRPLFPTTRPDFVRLGEIAVETLNSQITGSAVSARTYYYPVTVLWREPRHTSGHHDSTAERGAAAAAPSLSG